MWGLAPSAVRYSSRLFVCVGVKLGVKSHASPHDRKSYLTSVSTSSGELSKGMFMGTTLRFAIKRRRAP